MCDFRAKVSLRFGVLAIGTIGANGDGPNGTNGAPHRHWHQWRPPLVPMAITIGDHWIQ